MPNYTIQHRRDTTANWNAANPILLDGEVGYERTEDGRLLHKVGDGVRGADGTITGTHWLDLPYSSGPAGPSPAFEWSGPSLRFKNPDGTWGEWTDLQGPRGIPGLQGDPGPSPLAEPATRTTLGGITVGEGLDISAEGCLRALGSGFNDCRLITESGTFVAPVAGWALVLMISGGYGGMAGDGRKAWGAHGGNAGVARALFEYLQEGQEVPVTVGAGGLGGVIGYITGDEYGGAQTIFNGHSTHNASPDGRPVAGHLARATTNYYNASAVEQLFAVGAGINGGSATYNPTYKPNELPGKNFHNDACDGNFWGSGGGAYVHKNGFCCYGNGKQGAILVLFHNPAKAAGPLPTPALFMARAAARVATQPAVVNLYDPETGQGSVWLEEDAPAKLVEGWLSQEAWQEQCQAKAAEERAAWLASPDTEAERFDLLQAACKQRLDATDKLVQPDYPLSDEDRAAVYAYRTVIRELNHQQGAPWDGGGELTPWPEEPAVSKVVS